MKDISNKIKGLLNKDITSFIKKHKLPLVGLLVAILLTCVGFFVTYAFYQTVDSTPLIGGSTGKIADLEVRVMAQNRDDNGNAIDGYSLYPYIPRAGYVYNESKSYCSNGSTIDYDEDTYFANINAAGHDVCYLYFDATGTLDLTLYVYAQNVNDSGEGIPGSYTLLETTSLPPVGYKLHTENDEYKSRCTNGSTIAYSEDENLITVNSHGKDTCYAYMDAMDIDIALQVFVQYKEGSTEYYQAESIPTNYYYELHTTADEYQSACSGSLNADALSINRQKVVIAAANRTKCVAYLDLAEGPVLKSIQTSVNIQNVTVTTAASNLSTDIVYYYFSSDGFTTSHRTTSPTYTFTGLDPATDYIFEVYGEDADGKTSAILKAKDRTSYFYDNIFAYSGADSHTGNTQQETIIVSGYYKLQVWGAQGGNGQSSANFAGKGGYSEGVVYLNKNDVIYVNVGGQGTGATGGTNGVYYEVGGFNGGGNAKGGTGYYNGGGGATDIRIGVNDLYHRVIVAGGGGGNAQSASQAAMGYGGGTTGHTGALIDSPTTIRENGGYGSQIAADVDGGTQRSATVPAAFGLGGTGYSTEHAGYGSSGGGGGWYGGGHGGDDQGGGGGSGWVYTASAFEFWSENGPTADVSAWALDEGYLLFYDSENVHNSLNAGTYPGNETFVTSTDGSEQGHSGNGVARIRFIGETLN